MKHHGGEIIVRAAALLVVILAVLPRHDTAQGLNRKLPSLLVAATRVESAQEFISPREMVQAHRSRAALPGPYRPRDAAFTGHRRLH